MPAPEMTGPRPDKRRGLTLRPTPHEPERKWRRRNPPCFGFCSREKEQQGFYRTSGELTGVGTTAKSAYVYNRKTAQHDKTEHQSCAVLNGTN